MNFAAFRSLSRALLRGFVRDRTALVFSLLLPVLFLALFGSLYRSTTTPKLSVVEFGQVSLISHAGPGLSKVLTVSHVSSWEAGLRDVHQGTDDAAVRQIDSLVIVRYSRTKRSVPSSTSHRACSAGPSRRAPRSAPPSRW